MPESRKTFLEELQSLEEPTKFKILIASTVVIMIVVVYFWLAYFNGIVSSVSQPTVADQNQPAPAAVANHWNALPLGGKPRGRDSRGRQRAIERLFVHPPRDLHWLAPPVLNKDTRLVAVLDPATGAIQARGYERQKPATRRWIVEV